MTGEKMENVQEQKMTAVMREEEMEIDLKEVFFLLLHSWKAIFMAMLIGAVCFGGYYTFMVGSAYEATAELYITNTDSMITFSDLQLSAALTDDYAQIIKSRTVLKRVIEKLGLNLDYRQLRGMIQVVNPDSTHIIQIKVTCDDVALSRDIANALLNIGIDQIYQVIGSSEPTIIDVAEADAVVDVSPSLSRYLVMGAMLGAILVCAVVVVRMMLNTTIQTEEEVNKYLGIPVLSAVPYYKEKH